MMRHGRGTVVGDRLGLSQSGVSHALRRLRDVFDDNLFVRQPYGMTPTRKALELAPLIDSLIDLAEQALESEKSYAPHASDRAFRIGAADYLIPLIAGSTIVPLMSQSPNASVTFLTASAEDTLKRLDEGEFDLAIGCFGGADRFERLDLWSDQFVLVLRMGHPSLAAQLDQAALAGLRYVDVAKDERSRGPIERAFATAGLARQVITVVPRFLTAFSIAQTSNVAVVTPRKLADRFAPGFGLEARPLPIPCDPFKVSALRCVNRVRDAGVDWLLSLLEAEGMSAARRAHPLGRDEAAALLSEFA